MKLDEDAAHRRTIYFFDTPSLALFEAGVILRARIKHGDRDNSTVKIRPVDPSRLAREWRDMDEFNLEADWMGEREECSTLLNAWQGRGEIQEMAAGEQKRHKHFFEQKRILAAYADARIDFDSLAVVGPIEALRGGKRYDDFDHDVCIEEWRTGTDLIEASIELRTREGLRDRLVSRAVGAEGEQETKTRVAVMELAGTRRQIADIHLTTF